MKSKNELERDIQRAERAKQILNDTLVREALEGMEKTVFHNIKTSHFKNTEEREDLYKMLRAIEEFRSEFQRHIRGGEKAQSFLKKLIGK